MPHWRYQWYILNPWKPASHMYHPVQRTARRSLLVYSLPNKSQVYFRLNTGYQEPIWESNQSDWELPWRGVIDCSGRCIGYTWESNGGGFCYLKHASKCKAPKPDHVGRQFTTSATRRSVPPGAPAPAFKSGQCKCCTTSGTSYGSDTKTLPPACCRVADASVVGRRELRGAIVEAVQLMPCHVHAHSACKSRTGVSINEWLVIIHHAHVKYTFSRRAQLKYCIMRYCRACSWGAVPIPTHSGRPAK